MLDELDYRNQIVIFGVKALESQQERAEYLTYAGEYRGIRMDLLEREDDDLDDKLAQGHLEPRFFVISNVAVDEDAVDEMIEHSFTQHELAHIEIVLHGFGSLIQLIRIE